MYFTTFHSQLLAILGGQVLGKQYDIERIFVRHIQIIHMPRHSHLMTVEIRVCHTWIVGVNLESIGFDIGAKILVEI